MVHDKGPWSARIDEQGRMRICSEDFTHDVELILTGDFADVKQQAEYAANIIARLTSPEETRAEIRLGGDGALDEVVCRGDQLEQMDFNHWFLSLGDVAVWLHAKGPITATYERRTGERSAPQKREDQ